jgi:hypothetical protein
MKPWIKGLTFTIISALIIGSVVVYEPGSVSANNPFNLIQKVKNLGSFLKGKDNLVSQSLINFNTFNTNSKKIATVNGIPITQEEFDLRIGMANSVGLTDKNAIFNAIVEEKVILDFANKNNLNPSEKEVQEFIEQQKENYQQNEEFKNLVDALCLEADISLDDYWSKFEVYNTFRFLANAKVGDYFLNLAEKDGKITKQSTYQDKINISKSYILPLKRQAKVELSEDKGFNVDLNKIYK